MLMLGSVRKEGEFSRHMVQPSEVGGRETMHAYLVTPDAAALFQQVTAAGAEVVMELRTMDYGGGAFTVRDPEGHLWSVGSTTRGEPRAVPPLGPRRVPYRLLREHHEFA